MRNTTVIRTEAEYAAALEELKAFRHAEPENSPEAERLELLRVLIQAYESKQPESDPVDTIRLYLARHHKTAKDLEAILKCTRHRVWEILNRKRALTLPQIRALVNELGIPSDRLIAEYPVARGANTRSSGNEQSRVSP